MKRLLAWCNLALLMLPLMAAADFVDNGDGTVTDTGTGLMWQQDPVAEDHTWEQALAYCEHLDLAGHTDWRLPAVKALASLADFTVYSPAIDSSLAPYTDSTRYWTSTTKDGNPYAAWMIGFRYGYLHASTKTNAGGNRVRAVRGGEAGPHDLWPVPDTGQTQGYTATFGEDCDYAINPPSYTKLDDNCVSLPDDADRWSMVRDEVTGLVWETKHALDGAPQYADPNDADNSYTWYDGTAGAPGDGTDTLDFIDALNAAGYGGFSDWRMPNVGELLSIVDYGRHDPTVNAAYFPATAAANYWSSAAYAPSAEYAWPVNFSDSEVTNLMPASDFSHVRAVKDGCADASPPSTTTTTGPSKSSTTTIDGTTTTTAAGYCPARQILGEDNPALLQLRDFRDSTLARSAIGRGIIELYYGNAGSIQTALNKSPAVRAAARRLLDAIAAVVDRGE